jgi:hypothetical protein
MDIKQIIEELQIWKGEIPQEAIKQALNHKGQIVPVLIDILNQVTADPEKYIKQTDYWGHITALLILAQFHDKSACKPIADFFSLPEDQVWELTGEMITEDLSKILASVCNGDIEPIKILIEDELADDFVRAAAIDSLLIQLATQTTERSSIISYFEELFKGKLKKKPSFVWNHLAISIVNIYPEELFEEIDKAYKDGLIDREFIPLEQVEEALESEKEEVLNWLKTNSNYSPLEDPISILNSWMAPEE